MTLGRSLQRSALATAVAEALACCEHQKALGRLLLQSHSLCRALTWLTVALECAAPVGLLLCDGAARFALLLALLGFHGMLHLTLELCNFSVVCAALLCICVPAAAWDAGELFIRALWGAQATATPPPKAVGTEGPPAARSDPAHPSASARRLLSAQPLSAGLIGLTVIGAVVNFLSDTEPPAPPAAGLFGTGVPARDASAGGASGSRRGCSEAAGGSRRPHEAGPERGRGGRARCQDPTERQREARREAGGLRCWQDL